MDDLPTLLRDAAGAPRDDVDPAGLRQRVERRTRRRTVAIAVAVVLVLALPIVGVLVDDPEDVLIDRPPATPVIDPPGTTGALDVQVEVALTGPLAEELEAEWVVEEWGDQATVGASLDVGGQVRLATRGEEEVSIPHLGGSASPLREPSGLAVTVHPPSSVQVVAGGPAGAVGRVVGPTEVPSWLPRDVYVGLAAVGPVDAGARFDGTIPLGSEGALELTVSLVPSDEPALGTWPAPSRLVGTTVEVPPVGEATPAVVEGHPIWVTNTERFGVTVVDAVAPFYPGGVATLVGWCPSAQAFQEAWGGSRFTADGDYRFGPAVGGLARYEVEVAGDTARLVAAVDGPGRGPGPLLVDTPQGLFPEHGIQDEGVAGPWCDGGESVQGEDVVDQPFPLDRFPSLDLATEPVDAPPSRVAGRVVLDVDGTGWLCEGRVEDVVDPFTCEGASVPVDLTARTLLLPEGGSRSASDGPWVATVTDGVVTDLWTPAWASLVSDPADGTSRTYVTRWRGTFEDPETIGRCQEELPGCLGQLQLEKLEVRGPDGDEVEDPVVDGVLLEDVVVVDPWFGAQDGSFGVPITEQVGRPPGTDEGTPLVVVARPDGRVDVRPLGIADRTD